MHRRPPLRADDCRAAAQAALGVDKEHSGAHVLVECLLERVLARSLSLLFAEHTHCWSLAWAGTLIDNLQRGISRENLGRHRFQQKTDRW